MSIYTYKQSFVGLCTQCCVKVSSANRGECVTTGGLYRPTHLCVVHFESLTVFFCDVFFLRGGGGGEMVHVSGGRGFVWGFRKWGCELSSGLSCRVAFPNPVPGNQQ